MVHEIICPPAQRLGTGPQAPTPFSSLHKTGIVLYLFNPVFTVSSPRTPYIMLFCFDKVNTAPTTLLPADLI
jgi:hypothetical protein